jgi:hypothetical protein
LNFPYISTPVTLLTKWVAVPAAHFTTRTRTPTARTTEKLCLKALFTSQGIVASGPPRYIVPVRPLESPGTDWANKPVIVPTGFAVFFSQVKRIEPNSAAVSVRSAPTTVADGILGSVTVAAAVFIVRTNPEVVALAPVVITEHLIAIHTHRIKIINALLAHRSSGGVFQVAGG